MYLHQRDGYSLLYPAATHLHKRDEGYAIPVGAIIILAIMGAGLAICMGFAIMRLYGASEAADTKWMKRSPEQDAYMREVRERKYAHMPVIYTPNSYPYSNHNANMVPVPLSPSGGTHTTSAYG